MSFRPGPRQRKRSLLFASALALLVLGACGTSNLRPDQLPRAGQAVAFFVVNVQGARTTRFHFFAGDRFGSHAGYVDAKEGTQVYALPLEPGPYRLRQLTIGWLNMTMTKDMPCARSFQVAPGRSSYGGSFTLEVPAVAANRIGCDAGFGDHARARRLYEAAFPETARAFPPL